MVEVFSNRYVRRLLLAWLATSIATWGTALVLAVYAFDAGGAGAVGLMALVRTLPGAPAGPLLAREGDRRSRRSLLIVVNSVRAAVLGTTALAVAANAPLPLVYALVAVVAVAGPAYKPSQAALLPLLARTPSELSTANVAASMLVNLGFLTGTLGGGLLLAATSPGAVLVVLAGLFAVSLVPLSLLPRDRGRQEAAGAQRPRELLEGFRTVGGDRQLLALVGTLGALAVVEGAADVLAVATALGPLGLDEAGAGLLWAGWGMGAIAGGGGVLRLLDRRRIVLGLTVGAAVLGIALSLAGLLPPAAAVMALLAGAGAGFTLAEVAAHTLLQRLAADPILARVFGVVETMVILGSAVGGAGAGLLLEGAGPRLAWVGVGLVLPVVVLSCRRRFDGAELGPPAPDREYGLVQGNRIFAPLPIATKERLARNLLEIRAPDGAVVIAEGDVGDRFYLVAEGTLEVIEGGSYRRTMGPGDGFGEIALLRDTPRTATVRARDAVLVLALDRATFLAAVSGQPHSARAAAEVVDERSTRQP